MNKLLLLTLFFVFLPVVFAEDLSCQYTEFQSETVEVVRLIHEDTNEIWGDPLEFSDFTSDTGGRDSDGCLATFKVTNPNDKEANATIIYTYNWRKLMAGSSKSVNREILLGPNEAETISYTVSRCFDYANIDEETITYVLYDEGTITPTTRLEEISVEVCQSCEGNDCNNDGDSCSKSTECGGGFCVESYCSNDDFCFDNNCNCNENEIQCDNNKQCVTIGNVAIDTETMCQKDEECTTGYLDPETMLCAKSPSQLEEENKDWNKFLIYAVLIFVCLIIFGLALFWYQKHRDKIEEQKIEELRQKTLQKEMDLTIIKLEAKNKRLEKIKKDIKEINFQKRKKREELIKLNLLKNNRTNLLGDINNIEQEIDRKWHDLKPFPDKQAKNRLVVINPYLGGYKCFYKKGIELKDYPYSSLIHRWVWKKNNGRSPRPGYHIHHIDEDKYNNDPRNLEEIWGKDHYKGHRNLK